jgi:dihydroflavonol-4-reductase
MKVLVTGATGFLGSHLCRRLIQDGHEVTVLRRPTSNNNALSDLNLIHETGDVTDSESVNRAVKGNEVVVHAAAHLAHWGFHKETQHEVNVQGAKNVVEACQQFGVRRLLHISSVATIGIPERHQQPAREGFKFNLENSPLTYHISKKRAEETVLVGVEKGLDAVIVNPSSFWGPLGKEFKGAAFALIAKQMAIIPYFTGGMCVAHVQDVVEGIVAAIEKGKTGQRYILGGDNLPYRSIVETGAKKLGLKRKFVPIPNLLTGLAAMTLEPLSRITKRQPRITYAVHYCASRFAYYDSSKAKNELSYSPRDFNALLDECVAFTEAREKAKSNLSLSSESKAVQN